jgi:uncharacterized protein (TIGR02757 family)
MPARKFADALENQFRTYHSRQYVHPDPLEFLYGYDDPADREIVALVAASLAYGRVGHILVSVRRVLDRLGEAPARYVRDTSLGGMKADLAGIKHRWTTGDDIAAMLAGARRAIGRHGSLGKCLAAGISPADRTVLPALAGLVGELTALGPTPSLLPDPARGSACKRLHLMLRWLVRRDEVDPGGWDHVPAGMLIVPVDVHMHRIAARMGLTARRAADGRTAMEITAAFAAVRPDDPVRYDFSLTRMGINPDVSEEDFFLDADRHRGR